MTALTLGCNSIVGSAVISQDHVWTNRGIEATSEAAIKGGRPRVSAQPCMRATTPSVLRRLWVVV